MTKPDNKQRLYELLNESATVAFDMKRNIRYMVCSAESRDLNVIWMIKSIKFTEDTPIARIRMDSPCYAEKNSNLEEQAQSILTAYFINFSRFGGEVPNNWKQGTLQDIAEFSNGYAFKSKELLDSLSHNCFNVFKQGHINRGGGFNSGGTKSWYPKEKCTTLSKYILHKGDVLMAMTDMKDNVAILGNTALMTVDDQDIANQRVGILRSNGYKNTSYAYIYLLTNSFEFLKDLRSRANSGVQVNLSSKEIINSPVWIATEDVNKEFNSLAEPLLSMIMANDSENQRLSDLRETLLPQLISGELDVSDVNII